MKYNWILTRASDKIPSKCSKGHIAADMDEQKKGKVITKDAFLLPDHI